MDFFIFTVPKFSRIFLGFWAIMIGLIYPEFRLYAQSNQLQSIKGLGLELSQANTNLRAMAGVSQAVTDFSGINLLNPASYGYVYKYGILRKIALDLGFNVSLQNTLQANIRTQSTGTNINNISLRFPLHQGMGLVLALQPQSLIAFSQTSAKTDSNINGSANQALLGFGYNFRKWSTGLNLGYLFGKKQAIITPLVQSSTNPNLASVERRRQQDFYQGLSLNWGLLFAQRLVVDSADITHTYFKWGASIRYTPVLRGNRVQNNDILTVSGFQVKDTVRSAFLIQKMPLKLSTGFALTKEHIWLLAMDINFASWRNFQYAAEQVAYQNTWQLNLGGSFIPHYKTGNPWEHTKVKLGASIGNYPLKFASRQIIEWSLTGGFYVPIKRNTYTRQNSAINLAFEYVNRQAGTDFQAHFFNIVIGITLNDLWFLKSYQN